MNVMKLILYHICLRVCRSRSTKQHKMEIFNTQYCSNQCVLVLSFIYSIHSRSTDHLRVTDTAQFSVTNVSNIFFIYFFFIETMFWFTVMETMVKRPSDHKL